MCLSLLCETFCACRLGTEEARATANGNLSKLIDQVNSGQRVVKGTCVNYWKISLLVIYVKQL